MSELKFSGSHEWVSLEDDDVVIVGISDHAQELLGDIVFVELPEIGKRIAAGEEIAEVESVKAASDIYSPVSGEIVAVNDTLLDTPDIINASAQADGWLFKLKMSDPGEIDGLMDAASYSEHCQ